MLKNRSVPVETILPHLFYQNLEEAIGWLALAFGFEEHFRYGDPVSGAQLHLGDKWIMVARATPGRSSPAHLGASTQSLTVFLDEVETHFAKSKTAGAKILGEPHETEYGEFQYAATDIEGHLWLFSRHARDMSPKEWGATIARPKSD